jgi:hypothetical protein
VQKVHGIEAVLLARLDGTEVAWQWLAMTSRAGVWRSTEQRQRQLHRSETEAGKPPTRRRRKDEARAHGGQQLRLAATGVEASPLSGMVTR